MLNGDMLAMVSLCGTNLPERLTGQIKFILIYPFIWAIMTSLKAPREYRKNIYGFPKQLVFTNIQKAFNTKIGENATSLIGMFINSIWSSFLSAGCGILFSSMTAYVVTKYKFKGSKTILAIAIVIQTLPLVGTMPAITPKGSATIFVPFVLS